MDKERCVICQCKIEEPGNSPESPLEVIFLLGKVLEVPAPLLSKFQRGCPNVEGWISVCEQCRALVRECHQVYEQLCQLTRKWNDGQARIRGFIKNAKLEEEQQDEELEILDIGREVRKWVLSNELGNSTDAPVRMEEEMEEVLESIQQPTATSSRDPLAEESNSSAEAMLEEECENDAQAETDPDPPDSEPEEPPAKKTPIEPPNSGNGLCREQVRLHCPILGCSFTVADPRKLFALTRHQEDVHSAQEMASLPRRRFVYECVRCQMRYVTPSDIRKHLRVFHGPGAEEGPQPLVRCPVPGCLTVTLNCRALTNHTKHSHTKAERDALPPKPKVVECATCLKRFQTMDDWQDHQRSHSSIKKKAICDVCGAALRDADKLKFHKQNSITCLRLQGLSVELTHRCPECGKGCATRQLLKDHLRHVHHSTPLQCSVCGVSLSNKHSLNAHLARVHGQGDFLCPECGRAFCSQRLLDLHAGYRHNGDKGGFVCGEEECGGKRFPSRKQLENHVNQKHLKGEPGYKCEECGKGFYFSQYLKQHRGLVHRGIKMKRNRNRTAQIANQ